MIETILVPTDGSESADRAVEHAFELATRTGATVHCFYCVETHRYGEPALSSAEIVLDDIEDRAGELLGEIADRAGDRGVECSCTIGHGRPWEAVSDLSGDLDADLIVVGTRGRSRTRTGRVGSVAERVVRTADRPVLTT